MSTPGLTSSTESRALSLLGAGIGPETVASALGVSVSRISQLLSDEHFSAEVAKLRFENLSKHNERDNRYDAVEDALLEKLDSTLPLMHRPLEILRAISVINGAKRRGSSAPESITQQNTVVNLMMPAQIMQRFVTNINNQVITAGDQDLLTIQSGTLLNQIKERVQAREVLSDETREPTATERI